MFLTATVVRPYYCVLFSSRLFFSRGPVLNNEQLFDGYSVSAAHVCKYNWCVRCSILLMRVRGLFRLSPLKGECIRYHASIEHAYTPFY